MVTSTSSNACAEGFAQAAAPFLLGNGSARIPTAEAPVQGGGAHNGEARTAVPAPGSPSPVDNSLTRVDGTQISSTPDRPRRQLVPIPQSRSGNPWPDPPAT
jgi:hypothetical protein